MSIESSIREKLTNLLHPIELNIINDSSKHSSHAAMKGIASGETHFTVECISEEFNNVKLMQRHRMIHKALDTEFKTGLHALVLQTKTPDEAGMSAEDVESAKAASARSQ